MRKPVYYAYVAQESHPDSQGEKNTWWTKVGVAFLLRGKSFDITGKRWDQAGTRGIAGMPSFGI